MAAFDPKKRALLQGTGAVALLATAPAAEAKTAKASPATTAVTSNEIKSGWTFRQAVTGDWLKATVPGTVHTDLLANKKIEDPFFRTNEAGLQWIDKKDWEYRTTFTVDAVTFSRRNIALCFDGLDTFAEVYVNDQLVLTADNMFREWTADIKAHVKAGANALRILFRSPVTVGLAKLKDYGFNLPATNDQSENGGLGLDKVSPFARKAGYHYGWDWGPRFVTSGIWRKVHLRAWNTARIENLHLIQNSVSATEARITAVVEIEADRAGTVTVDIASPTDAKIRAVAQVAVKPGLTTARLSFAIKNPKLWWSNGLGAAHLYAITARATSGKTVLDSRSANLGVRTLKVVQTPDQGGASFYFELNGVPVFIKGANYIPNDSFLTRVTYDTYDKVIGSAVKTHMNMIRVWGGGVYEDDYFYDQCDKSGILVWQDFMFACSMYPNDAAFLDNVRQEAMQNVRRLRNHPSIAIWAGNNEIDSAWQNDVPNGGWGWKQPYSDAQKAKIWEAYDAIFHKILPEVVAEHDKGRFYWPSSPLASWDGKSGVVHADHNAKIQSGDLHYWDVWWGQKPFEEYRTHIGRFMSEYGFQSFPEFSTVKTYAIPADYDIFSDVMKAHQRSSIGNGTIKNYMQRDYKVPADFQQFLYVGQVLQAEGIKVAMEAHRSRMPYCMGSLFWQINDCWPVASWSSIDYYGRWKAQQYFAVKAFDKWLLSLQLDGDTLTVYAVSDDLMILTEGASLAASLRLRLMDFKGKILSERNVPFTLNANTSTKVLTTSVAEILGDTPADSVCLYAAIMTGSGVMKGLVTLRDSLLYFKPVKDLVLPKPDIKFVAKADRSGQIFIALTTDVLAKNLYLSLEEGEGWFSDNYFDLLPGEPTVVRFLPASKVDVKAFAANLRMMHMADIT